MTWQEFCEQDTPPANDSKMEAARRYLRLDSTDDDVTLFFCMKAAVSYVISAVSAMPDGNPRADMLVMAMTQDLYDNRELMQSDIQQKKAFDFKYRSIILQLQCEVDLKEGEAVE